jgi:hypothetical protein
MKAQASVPLGAVVIADGAVWIAWIMPSLAPNRTRLRRPALAVRKASCRALSADEAWTYQIGNPGLVRIAGVEVSIAPSRDSSMPVLPTPNRALRTQLMIVAAWVASLTASVVWSAVDEALLAVKSRRVVPLAVAV